MRNSPKPVEETVSAAEANRQFSKLLRGVREGRSYVVTSHGEPVARLAPVEAAGKATAEQIEGRKKLFERLETQPAMTGGWEWNREELYEEMLSEPFKSE